MCQGAHSVASVTVHSTLPLPGTEKLVHGHFGKTCMEIYHSGVGKEIWGNTATKVVSCGFEQSVKYGSVET